VRWPWQNPPSPPTVVDSSVARRLEEVAARLELVAQQLADKVQEYEEDDDADAR
jgi:hypothetical protein